MMTRRHGTQIKSRSGPPDLDQVVDLWWGDDTPPLSGGHSICTPLNKLLAKDAQTRSRSDNRLPLYEMRQNPRRRGDQDSRGIPMNPQMVVSIFTQQIPEGLPAHRRTNTVHPRGGTQKARRPLGQISTNCLRLSTHKKAAAHVEPVSEELNVKVTCVRERDGFCRVQAEHREKLCCMCEQLQCICVSSCAVCVRAAEIHCQ